MPNTKFVVFNNNPLKGQIVKKTRGFWGDSLTINSLCQKELRFVSEHPCVERIIEVPRSSDAEVNQLPFHGDVLDFVFEWGEQNNCESLLHIEPDCCIYGDSWLNDMLSEINKGNWVVGSKYVQKDGGYVMPLCPTLWLVKPVNELRKELGLSFNKYGPNINTAQKILRACCNRHKASYVDISPTFKHFEGGSGIKHPASTIKI